MGESIQGLGVLIDTDGLRLDCEVVLLDEALVLDDDDSPSRSILISFLMGSECENSARDQLNKTSMCS